ncbi:MAG: hypothetical protein IH613_08640 [Desulfuromonadales bacterium]|nr:hypothetical protein [Desulfuromonadales bacterium]
MGTQASNGQGPFDFIDRLIGLFHHSDSSVPKPAPGEKEPLNKQFETSLIALEKTIEKQQREKESEMKFGWQRALKVEDEEVKKNKEQKIYEKIRQNIESAHLRLDTGISSHELDLLKEYLVNANQIFTSGEKSHEVLPRCRASILKRIHSEAGSLALNQMDDYLAKQNETWPTRPPRNPAISTEEIQEIAKHNLITMRKNFIKNSIHQSSLLIVGIVDVWKSDYPEDDSDLWKSVVLEAVGTALRAKLMHLFTTKLRHDREFIENKISELIGAKVAELNHALQGGVTSINDAHRVVSSSLKILDEVIPTLAWEHLQKVVSAAK